MKFTAAIALIAVAADARYKSGAVTGYEDFTYGKFVVRMKAPNKKGTVTSFFTYWNGPGFYTNGWNELDVEIVPTKADNPFSMNIIYGDGHSKRESHNYASNFDPKDEWHVYEMLWTPEYVAWTIDGNEVRRSTTSDPAVGYMNKGQKVMMNFWTPTFSSWGAGFNDWDMPWYAYYDYIETYHYNFDTKGFDFHWRDDFDSFDYDRWHKSDNSTFDSNSTTFRASQISIQDGNLVLKMEPDYRSDAATLESHPIKTKVYPHLMAQEEAAKLANETPAAAPKEAVKAKKSVPAPVQKNTTRLSRAMEKLQSFFH